MHAWITLMKKTIAILVLFAGALLWASTCFVAVDETEFVIIKRFGRPRTTVLTPGLCLKLPAPIENVVRFDNRLQVFEDPRPQEPPKEYLTRDKKNVEVATATCWRIARSPDAVLAFLATVQDRRGAELRLCDMVKSQLNGVLGAQDFDTLISTNGAQRRWHETIASVRTACADRATSSFGVEIVDLRIQRLSFPAQNRRHVFDRMRAERERIAKQYRSEGEALSMRIIADAQFEQERILAQARAEAARIRGEADAEATRVYGAAYSTDPEFYRFTRTLQAYERGLDADTTLVLPADAPFLRLLINPDAAPQEQRDPDPSLDLNKLSSDGESDRQPEPAPGS
jgi:membrane protease subunit HflC